MSRMLSSKTYKKLCLTFTFIVACICLTVLSSVHTAYAKSLNVTDVTISATVNSDGTIDVTETRTFDFSGGTTGFTGRFRKDSIRPTVRMLTLLLGA